MFNERLKLLRKNSGMSQSVLAERLNVSQQTVAKWESGVVSPKPSAIVEIAEIFGVSSDYLLGIKPKITDRDIISVLFDGNEEVTDDMYEDVKRFAAFLIENKNKAERKDNK